MSGDQWIGLLWFAGAITLVASGLIARRLPVRRTVGTAAAWAGIFALAYLLARMFA